MPSPLLWLTESDIVSLVDLNDAVDALERGLRRQGEGQSLNVAKALGGWGDGSSMHSLGSAFPEFGYVGFKNWVNTKRGATALFVMFDANDGSLVAVMEAVALGQLRTSAISGVATRWLATEQADDMALIGTGAQSITQVAAIAAVRALRRLRVFSPTAERRQAFVSQLRGVFPFTIDEHASVEAAVRGASIVTLVTRAREPFLASSMLAHGAHVNAVGAILPQNAEFSQDVFERAGMVVVDDLPNVQKASRELIEHYGKNRQDDWSSIRSLSDIIAKGTRRPSGCDLTLFKAMGMGISDLSMAVLALERARQRGIGREIPHPHRAVPTWRASAPA